MAVFLGLRSTIGVILICPSFDPATSPA